MLAPDEARPAVPTTGVARTCDHGLGGAAGIKRSEPNSPVGQDSPGHATATIRLMRNQTLKRVLLAAVTTAAVALAGPVAGAGAYTYPTFKLPSYKAPTYKAPTYKLPAYKVPAYTATSVGLPAPATGNVIGGNEIGSAGCVGTNRPSVGGNNGSTANQTCGAILSFTGPAIGQVASVIGPTIIGSPGTSVIVTAGPVTASQVP